VFILTRSILKSAVQKIDKHFPLYQFLHKQQKIEKASNNRFVITEELKSHVTFYRKKQTTLELV
jgi:hypothetical protein